MSTKMQLGVRLDQRLSMNQQLSQAITLLQYNTLDLKQLVQQYIETNPLIDLDDIEPSQQSTEVEASNNSSSDNEELSQLFNYSAELRKNNYNYDNDDNSLDNVSTPKTLRSHLLEQTYLCKFNPIDQIIAESIIDSIDENGKVTMSIAEIQASFPASNPPSLEQIELILSQIQRFDPNGIAYRDLRECLLIQINHILLKEQHWKIAHSIVETHFDSFATNNVKPILKCLGISHQEYAEAVKFIKTLNPRPGLSYAQSNNITIEPELYVKKTRSTWKVFLSESILTKVKINHYYHELIKQNKKHTSFNAINKELQEAQWLLKGLKRRNETLLNVASHIIKLQVDFLDHGKAFMRPMNISDVSQALNIHESTVSRVTTGKYISTPRGIFELKYFFPSYVLTQSGNTCSDTAVKEMIKDIVASETGKKIYSDSEIANMLKEKGINIARRTVAKYRDALKILPSYQRSSQTTNSYHD